MALTAALYAPTLGYGFVYEDLNVPESMLQPWRGWLWEAANIGLSDPRSLTRWTYRFSVALSGPEPWGFHLINVLLHLLNGWLVWRVAAFVMTPWLAVFAAGVFWLHPVQVESVAYIASRADLVAGTCVLLALWAVAVRSWPGAVLACVLAVLAKEAAIAAWPALLIWAWALGRLSLRDWPTIWGGVALGLLGVAVVLRLGVPFSGELVFQQLGVITALLTRVVWPVGLTIDPDWTALGDVWRTLSALAWIGAALAVIGVPSRSLGLLLGWPLLVLAPRLVVPLAEGLHEHHLYLPLIGIVVGLGRGLTTLAQAWDETIPRYALRDA